MFEKVLVPLDGSDAAESSLPFAAIIAAQLNSELVLVHVLGRGVTSSEVVDSYLASAVSRVRQAADGLGGRRNELRVSSAAITGSAGSALMDFAQSGSFGLIVLTSHGASGGSSPGLGSVATKLAHDLRVPLLLIPAGAKNSANDVFTRIVVPLDDSEAGEAALPLVKDLALAKRIEVTLLHVMSSAEQVHTVGGIDYFRLPESVVERLREEAEAYLAKVVSSFEGTQAAVRREIRFGNPVDEINKLCQETSAGLIALSSHGHSAVERWVLGSISDKVLRSTRVPVLLVRGRPGA